MKLLVTGGAGFIGSALVRRLVAEGHTVVNVDKLTYAGNLDSIAEYRDSRRHLFERVDIADGAAVREVFERHQPDGVLHLAAESHVDRSIDSPAEFLATNVHGTYMLLEEARRHWQRASGDARERFRFVHVSTDEVYGSLGPTDRFTENSRHGPNSPYAASKAAADHLARAWHHTYGLPVITTNCSNNYGPYQFPEKLIPLVISKARLGEPLPVYGKGDNVRDWIYVDDHVDGLLAALKAGRPGETYNIGSDNERTNLAVVEAICDLLDEITPDPRIGSRRSLITFVQDRPGHDHRYAIDASKIRGELGWAPRESFASGLRRTVQWYLTHQAWMDRIYSGAYRGERIGLAEARR